MSVSVSMPDAAMLRRLAARLPPGWSLATTSGPPAEHPRSFTVSRQANGFLIRDEQGFQSTSRDEELTVWMLVAMLRRAVVAQHRDLTCVQGSTVMYEGLGILVTGPPLSGTSALAKALVTAGAELCSDDLAMLDADGLLVPRRGFSSDRTIAGARVALGLVALALYVPGAAWSPVRLTPGEAVVALLGHVAGVPESPAQTLATLRLALAHAQALKGDRGDAGETAAALLEALAGAR